jgi:serine/threonine-protein kinase
MTDGKVVPLGIAGIRPLAVLDGMLVYLQADGRVMAVALDVRGKRTRGAPIPVHDPVQVASGLNGNSGIFVSSGGGLVTSRVGSHGRLAWASRDGRIEQVSPQLNAFQLARLSPDERRIAVLIAEGAKRDVWIYDMALATFSRLTSVGDVLFLEWSADGTRIVFATADGDGGFSVWSQLASGVSPASRLFHQAEPIVMATMAPDGKSLLVNTPVEDYWGLFRVPLDSAPVARSYLLPTKAILHAPQFSPDGKWVAFLSTESGRDEVYVRSFPDASSKIQVSVAGGFEPAWSRDGRHLYYRSGSSLLEARMSLSPTLAVLARDTVLSNAIALGSQVANDRASYQPTRDDKRFLTIFRDGNDFELVISPNWITELRRRVAESSGKR